MKYTVAKCSTWATQLEGWAADAGNDICVCFVYTVDPQGKIGAPTLFLSQSQVHSGSAELGVA